ncbi:MAG: glycosyltransferase family A protein [Methylococcales bacterium]
MKKIREHRIIVVTPAGRKAYLEILKTYILKDESIDEWILWDNCRLESDRIYIKNLAKNHTKIKIITQKSTDGTNQAINQFYKTSSDKNVFYIKIDDDIVYLPEHFGQSLYNEALIDRYKYTYWSPLVVNNAICSWLLKYHSKLKIDASLMASAACNTGWKSPEFAECLHKTFITAHRENTINLFHVPNFDISLARFSINCIGFFGQEVAALGDSFCPLDADDEEYISAVLPSKTGRPGRIIGNIIVSHFSFFTQENYLIKTGVLNSYFNLINMRPIMPPIRIKKSFKQNIIYTLIRILKFARSKQSTYSIGLDK